MTALSPVMREMAQGCAYAGGLDTAYQAAMLRDSRLACGPGGMYRLFQQMEDTDAHLFAVLQTRKNALLACEWRVIPADDTPEALRAADLVRRVMDRIPRLQSALYHLLDAVGKGFAVTEVLWRLNRETDEIQVEDLRSRFQGDFAFDGDGELYLLGIPGHSEFRIQKSELPSRLLPRPGEAQVWSAGARRMPARKFLHMAFQGNRCNPYGAALCAKAYWYHWYKRNNLQFWSTYNGRFGSPSILAYHPATLDEYGKQELRDELQAMEQEALGLVSEEVRVELLEGRRGSAASSYREMLDWCNDEMSKIVLGQTLTTGEGRRSGSLALARVHDQVRRDYLESDARALGEMLSSQLARWITDFNLGEEVPSPRVVFDCAAGDDQVEQLNLDRELVKLGVSLPSSYFYEKYRRPQPAAGDAIVRYDDGNLYQYHLLYGVLTINEVRASLGLPPVPWGDDPPGAGEAGRAGASGPGAGRMRGRGEGRDADDSDGDGGPVAESRSDRRNR